MTLAGQTTIWSRSVIFCVPSQKAGFPHTLSLSGSRKDAERAEEIHKTRDNGCLLRPERLSDAIVTFSALLVQKCCSAAATVASGYRLTISNDHKGKVRKKERNKETNPAGGGRAPAAAACRTFYHFHLNERHSQLEEGDPTANQPPQPQCRECASVCACMCACKEDASTQMLMCCPAHRV